MASSTYHDFHLIIHPPDGEGRYRAQVLGSGGGDAEERFTWAEIYDSPPPKGREPPPAAPSRKAELTFDDDLFSVVDAQPPSLDYARAFGTRLFKAVFKGEVYVALRRSFDRARPKPLRLRLNLTGVPELVALPWEFLFNDKIDIFYAQLFESPIVRYLGVDGPPAPLLVDGPLRVLVMVADVAQLAKLDVEEEWQDLLDALEELRQGGQVEIERLVGSSARALVELLMRRRDDRPFHVLHFIGHGVYNPETRQGALLVTDAGGKEVRPLNAERLSGILRNHSHSLRLVVLNSCEGARTDGSDAYAGMAQSLTRQGAIPAVVAMQYRITDRAAVNFTHHFYNALAVGNPVEAALSHGRAAIFAEGEDIEWATPVLYLHAESGQLFEPRRATPPGPAPRVDPALADHYKLVLDELLGGKLVPFIGLDVNLYGRPSDPHWRPGRHLPSGRELTAYLADIFEYPPGEPLDLVNVSQYAAVSKKGLGGLYDELSNIFNRQYEVTELHRFLAGLPELLSRKGYPPGDDKLRHRFLIATTTYDNLLERAFSDTGRSFHVVSYIVSGEQSGRFYHAKFSGTAQTSPLTLIADPNNYPALSDPDPVVLKLPGAVEQFEQRFAIIEDHFSDYLTYKDLSGLLPPQLKGKLRGSSHLFLGSGLRNWHLRALLYRIWESRRASRPSWAIHQEPQPMEERFWKAAEVTLLQADLSTYIAGLRELADAVPPAKKEES